MALRHCYKKILGTPIFFFIHGMDPFIIILSGTLLNAVDCNLQPIEILAYAWALTTKM